MKKVGSSPGPWPEHRARDFRTESPIRTSATSSRGGRRGHEERRETHAPPASSHFSPSSSDSEISPRPWSHWLEWDGDVAEGRTRTLTALIFDAAGQDVARVSPGPAVRNNATLLQLAPDLADVARDCLDLLRSLDGFTLVSTMVSAELHFPNRAAAVAFQKAIYQQGRGEEQGSLRRRLEELLGQLRPSQDGQP